MGVARGLTLYLFFGLNTMKFSEQIYTRQCYKFKFWNV